ncbi:MAG: chlorophyll synthesis pathway protein BchC [Pseudomonadota bacterium]
MEMAPSSQPAAVDDRRRVDVRSFCEVDIELEADAITFEGSGELAMRRVRLNPPAASDLVIDIEWSGVSTGTERLLWRGNMPPFPGLAYPLVPGYEAVGRVVWADENADRIGERVFVPGARCFEDVQGLFGAAASRLVAPAARVARVSMEPPEDAILFALAATAYHALDGGEPPDLIVGHGVLGRLLARIAMALGAAPPVVWEVSPERLDGEGYAVIEPECDARADYRSIYDVSGDPGLLDELISRLKPGGEVTLAGFYADRLSFAFPPAFMKEARLRVAAEWKDKDLKAVQSLINDGSLSLRGLITHREDAVRAGAAYRSAFEDPACLKMILDWRRIHG